MLKKITIFRIAIVFFVIIFIIPVQWSMAGYDDFTINVPNGQDGYTAIVIKKSGDGYVGPQGEYYPRFPTVAQLRVMYGISGSNVNVVPVTYVQPTVQREISYQVINQAPEEQRGDDYNDHPDRGLGIAENDHNIDEKGLTFFEFKKKKKSQESQSNNQNTNSKPPVVNKGQPSQNQKVENKTTNTPNHKDDKSGSQNKAGVSP